MNSKTERENFISFANSSIHHPFCQRYFKTSYDDGGGNGRIGNKTISDIRGNLKPPENIFHGTLGESEWIQQKKPQQYWQLQPNQPLTITTDNNNELITSWLAGDIKMRDIEDLERRLDECCRDKENLRHQLQKQQRLKDNEGRRMCKKRKGYNLEHLLELQYVRTKCGDLQEALRVKVALWDDDVFCGFTLYRELQNLLIDRATLKKKSNVEKILYHQSAKENGDLKANLKSAMIKLDSYRILVDSIQRPILPKPTVKKPSQSELEERLLEMEENVKKALERLIEEQMQREIDEIKSSMLFTGIQRRTQIILDRLRRYQKENDLLKQRVEELLKVIEDLKKEKLELQRKLETTENELRSAKKELEKLKNEIEQLKLEIKKREDRNENLALEILEFESKLFKKEAEIRDLKNQLKDAEDKTKRAEEREKEAVKDVEKKEQERRKLQEEIDILKREVEQLKRLLETKEKECKQTVERLEKERDEAETKLRKTEEDNFSLRGRLEDFQRQLETLKHQHQLQLYDLEAKNRNLKHQIETMTIQVTHMTTQRAQDHDEIEQLRERVQVLQKELADEKEKQKKPPVIGRTRPVAIEHTARPRILRPYRSVVRIEQLSRIRPSTVQRLRPIAIPPKKSNLIQHKAQRIYIKKEAPEAPKRTAASPVVPKVSGAPKQQLSPVQTKLLKGAEAASVELLKRKPIADELAAVAVTGAQQQRRFAQVSPRSPRSSSASLSPEISIEGPPEE